VQPIVFHRVMDAVPAGGLQVAQGPEGLTVLLSGVREGFTDAALIDSLRREFEAQGTIVPPVKVRRVPTIPRTAVGRAPLIKSYMLATTPQAERGRGVARRPNTGGDVC
jgi:phenylacetate-CoA ligase